MPPQFRLYRDGKEVKAERYLDLENQDAPLKAASFVNCLAEGATLIIDSVQQHVAAIRGLSESFQDALRARTVVNLYAGWRTQKGFSLHWDPQDLLILQVSGRKHWKVYRPTRVNPLSGDLVPAPPAEDSPVWDGILEDGDMIYLPRGWWHVAYPLDGPSLHLTVTVMPASGEDLIKWLTRKLRRHTDIRMNVPHLARASERKVYTAKLRELVLGDLTDDVLEHFMAEWESHVTPRSNIRLPLAPLDCLRPIDDETAVRLASNRTLVFLDGPDNSVFFHANGVRWDCPAELVPALALLQNSQNQTVAQLRVHLSAESGRSELAPFLTALAMGGVVWLESSAGP